MWDKAWYYGNCECPGVTNHEVVGDTQGGGRCGYRGRSDVS